MKYKVLIAGTRRFSAGFIDKSYEVEAESSFDAENAAASLASYDDFENICIKEVALMSTDDTVKQAYTSYMSMRVVEDDYCDDPDWDEWGDDCWDDEEALYVPYSSFTPRVQGSLSNGYVPYTILQASDSTVTFH